MNITTDTLDELANPFENTIDATENEHDGQRRSLRRAIYQNCKDCIYDEHVKGEGNWRQQVEKCLVSKCALYSVRPTSKSKKLPVEE